MQTLEKPRWGGRPRGFHLDCARAQRLKSLLKRAGDQCRSALGRGHPGEKHSLSARWRKLELARQQEGTALGPGGPRVLAVSRRYFVSLGPAGREKRTEKTPAKRPVDVPSGTHPEKPHTKNSTPAVFKETYFFSDEAGSMAWIIYRIG
jgi:hypothetical protein